MITDTQAKELIKKFFIILDTVEESDSGTVFRPTQISSCRTMDVIALETILKDLKEWSKE